MTLQEFGLHLAEKRQERSLSHADVANFLKLSPQTIKAMDEGNLENLPHAVYARAFYRSYAEYIDIDKDLLEEALKFFVNNYEENTSSTPIRIKPSRRRYKMLTVLFVIVLLLLGALYSLMSSSLFSDFSGFFTEPNVKQAEQIFSDILGLEKNSDEKNSEEKSRDDTNAAVENTPKNEGISNETTENQTLNQSTEQGNAPPFEAGLPASKASEPSSTEPAFEQEGVTTANIPASPAEKAQGPETSSLESTETARGSEENTEEFIESENEIDLPPTKVQILTERAEQEGLPRFSMGNGTTHRLEFFGIEDCWLGVSFDGSSRQFLLKPGVTLSVLFDRSANVRFGNASGVQVTFNGEILPPIADQSGEVLNVTYPRP